MQVALYAIIFLLYAMLLLPLFSLSMQAQKYFFIYFFISIFISLILSLYEMNPAYVMQLINFIAITVYLLYSKKNFHLRSSLFIIAIIASALIHDTAVTHGLYQFSLLSPVAFCAGLVILFMDHLLRFISHHKETKELNLQLEEKISEGTMDLLFNDFEIKSYSDAITRFSGKKKEIIDNETLQYFSDYNKTHSFFNIMQELHMITGEQELLDRLIARIMAISGAETGILFLLNDNGDMEIKASKSSGKLTSYNFELIEKTLQNRTWNTSTGKAGEDKVYVLSIPVTAGKEIIGVCYLEDSQNSSIINTAVAETIHAFMSQASVTLENIRLKKSLPVSAYKNRNDLSDDIMEKLQKVKDYIDQNFTEDLSREGLAGLVEMHPDTLSRAFKSFSGKKLHDYINFLKIKKAEELLERSDMNIISIAYKSGFESLTTFNRTFMRIIKKTPSEYRKDRQIEHD